MRWPRVRFTVRRMMVAVAIVALIVGGGVQWGARRVQFTRLANSYYRQEAYAWGVLSRRDDPAAPSYRRLQRRVQFYGRMKEKYDHASRYPLFPVWPDPPEPE